MQGFEGVFWGLRGLRFFFFFWGGGASAFKGFRVVREFRGSQGCSGDLSTQALRDFSGVLVLSL